jgi:hypothetical protein
MCSFLAMGCAAKDSHLFPWPVGAMFQTFPDSDSDYLRDRPYSKSLRIRLEDW